MGLKRAVIYFTGCHLRESLADSQGLHAIEGYRLFLFRQFYEKRGKGNVLKIVAFETSVAFDRMQIKAYS